MTRDEAVTRIQEGLRFRTDQADRIKARLEEARIDLEMGKTLPWFLLQEDQPLVLAAGSSSITIPTGFIRRAPFERLRYTPSDSDNSVVIPWRTLDDAELAFGDNDAAGPEVAVLRTATIRIFPTADIAYTLTWSYYAHSSALGGSGDVTDNAWLLNAPDALIGEAGWRMAKDLGNEAAAAHFQEMLTKGRLAVFGEIVAREADDGPLVMGANN